MLRRLPDPRRQDQLYNPNETLIWSGILIFLLAVRSRRQFRFQCRGPAFVPNLNAVAQSRVECAPHDDTIAYYLTKLPPESGEELPPYLVRRLIRMKALDRWRFYGAVLVRWTASDTASLADATAPIASPAKARTDVCCTFIMFWKRSSSRQVGWCSPWLPSSSRTPIPMLKSRTAN